MRDPSEERIATAIGLLVWRAVDYLHGIDASVNEHGGVTVFDERTGEVIAFFGPGEPDQAFWYEE